MDFLRPEQNVWRVERASRASVLIDTASFFAAVRAACLKAQRSILVIGWDIDSRTRLVGDSGTAADGHAGEFARFLSELVAGRPELEVHLLLWDYSLLYAGEQELMPRLSLDWEPPDRVTLCIDDTVPFGSAQHQKIVVVDDALAFSGGLDVTIRGWDTGAHAARDPRRLDPAGEAYRPVHDVQMMVDGAAAQALALLARERWCRARGGVAKVDPLGDPWPEEIVPDFTDIPVGIARTQPGYVDEQPVREAESLFLDSIDLATREIYIENQFLTCPLVADRLARRLEQVPGLEVVIVAPRSHDSWVERRTMRNGRIRFWRRIRAAGGNRVRLLYPAVEQEGRSTDTMVHSKVMIVDDRFLRVGSANLNNRSMGADTECDLAIEARDAAERATVRRTRSRLLADHCGMTTDDVEAACDAGLSLVAAVDKLSGKGHRLRPIEDGDLDRASLSRLVERFADPADPIRPGRFLRDLAGRLRPVLAILFVVLVVVGMGLAWRHATLSGLLSADNVRAVMASVRGEPWAIVVVCGTFVLAGILVFPLNVLVLATAAVFGPGLGLLYSVSGALASGIVVFGLGRGLGRNTVNRLLGGRWKRAIEGVRKRGLLTVVTFRLLPLAPYSLVNLAAGAGGIRFRDFLLGTIIGIMPGMILLSIMGDRILRILADPSLGDIGILLLCVAGLIGLAAGAQSLLSRSGKRP